jgi:hypothetical protein
MSLPLVPLALAFHSNVSFPTSAMLSSLIKPSIARLAAGGVAISSALLVLPAQAGGTCTSGLLINTIYMTNPVGYTCVLGDITYTFSSDITELNTDPMNPNGPMVNFESTGDTQTISFVNLNYAGNVVYEYTLFSPKLSILPYSTTIVTALQTYTQNPNINPPTLNTVISTKVLPQPPNTSITFMPNFTPYTDPNDPFFNAATLTSLTNTIRMTPGPLPALGAGLTFAMSRKLRQRIKQAA